MEVMIAIGEVCFPMPERMANMTPEEVDQNLIRKDFELFFNLPEFKAKYQEISVESGEKILFG